ncbi:hypothetical protein Tco_0417633 [Tanacetum coccineum]
MSLQTLHSLKPHPPHGLLSKLAIPNHLIGQEQSRVLMSLSGRQEKPRARINFGVHSHNKHKTGFVSTKKHTRKRTRREDKSIVYTDHSDIKYLFAKKDAKPRMIAVRFRNTTMCGISLSRECLINRKASFSKMFKHTSGDDHLLFNNSVSDQMIRRCVHGKEALDILEACTSGHRGTHSRCKNSRQKDLVPLVASSVMLGHILCNDQFAKVLLNMEVTHLGENRASWSDKLDDGSLEPYQYKAYKNNQSGALRLHACILGKACQSADLSLSTKLTGALKHDNLISIPPVCINARMSRIFEASRARGICPSITRASQSSASFGNPDILILSTNVYL